MPATRTPKGSTTLQDTDSIGVAAVTVAAGSTLLAWITVDDGGFGIPPDGVTWAPGATYAFTHVGSTSFGFSKAIYCYILPNCVAGTGPVNSDMFGIVNAVGTVAVANIAVEEISAVDASPLDQFALAVGAGTTPASGVTGTTAQADEMLCGAVATEGPISDTALTWLAGWNPIGRIGSDGGFPTTNCTLAYAWQNVAAIGNYYSGGTGITARDCAALIVTLKAAVLAGGPDVVQTTPMTIGRPVTPDGTISSRITQGLASGLTLPALTTTPVEEVS